MRAFQSPSDLRPRRIYQVTIACCVKLLCIKTKQQLSSYDLRCTFLWKYDLLCMHACMQTRLAPECALEQPRAVLWAELPGWACARWSKVGRKRPNRCHTGPVMVFFEAEEASSPAFPNKLNFIGSSESEDNRSTKIATYGSNQNARWRY